MHIFLIKATQLILALAFLIIVHEFGHFLFARIFGIRVEKFYIFFDPMTELFKWRPGKYIGFFGSHRWLKGASEHEREAYYKRIEDLRKLREYESKEADAIRRVRAEALAKARQEGIAAFLKAWFRRYTIQDVTEPLTPPDIKLAPVFDDEKENDRSTKRGFWKSTEYGIGWIPLGGYCKIAGMIDESMDTEQMKAPAKKWEFRGGWRSAVQFPSRHTHLCRTGICHRREVYPLRPGIARHGLLPRRKGGGIPRRRHSPAGGWRETWGALSSGIGGGDEIIAIDSVATASISDFHSAIESQAEANKRKLGSSRATLNFTVVRGKPAAADTITIPVTLSEGNKMGVGLEVDITKFYEPEIKHYNLLTAIPRGIQMGTDKLTAYAKSMKQVATKEGMKSIGGFGAIGSIFPEKWDWVAFWNIAAFLSVALAFMNIIPIPALDRVHVRSPPSQRFMEYAQMCGMLFLILLLLYANGMDIVRLFMK